MLPPPQFLISIQKKMLYLLEFIKFLELLHIKIQKIHQRRLGTALPENFFQAKTKRQKISLQLWTH